MSSTQQAIEAFMATFGADPVSPEALKALSSVPEAPGKPSGLPLGAVSSPHGVIDPSMRVEMLESLALALLAERAGVKAEDFLGPEAAANPQLVEVAEALDYALKQFIGEMTYVCLPDLIHNKLWMSKLIPHLKSRMQARLAAVRSSGA